jgi:hypothetical protein
MMDTSDRLLRRLRSPCLGLGMGCTLSQGSGFRFPIFVDSVNGSDSNNGLTSAAAFATLGAAATAATARASAVIVYLARGSTFKEQFDVPINNLSMAVYGSGAMPVVDGADAVTSGWTQPDAVTYPNVWSRSWSRASATTTSSEMLGYWEAGSRTTRRTSLSLLQAGSNGDWHTTSLTTQTSTVSIRAAADPNSDGILREITKRHYGINHHSTTLGVTRSGFIVSGPIEIKRSVGHYNNLSLGTGAASTLLLRDGNVHHATSEALSHSDLIGTEYSPDIAPSVFTSYQASGSGFAPSWSRCMALMPGGSSRVVDGSGFYGHSAVTQEPASLTVQGCATRGLNFANASAQALIISGGYCEDPYQTVLANGSVLTTASNLLVRDTAATPLAAGNLFLDRQTTTGTFNVSHCASFTAKGRCVRNVTGGTKPIISNSAIVNTTNGTGLQGGEFNLTYSIIYTNGRPLDAITNLHVADYNVFYFVGQTKPNPSMERQPLLVWYHCIFRLCHGFWAGSE